MTGPGVSLLIFFFNPVFFPVAALISPSLARLPLLVSMRILSEQGERAVQRLLSTWRPALVLLSQDGPPF